ncbi:MAG: hypothetical protein SGI99_05925 [Pseudomonadota bacterium]|nr:hypothetical protein [Pseudomonadota bacterium]
MMPELALALVFFLAVLALGSWRSGLILCTLTALLQDPMRKLTPNEPVYFVVLVGAVFGAAWIGALLSRVALRPSSIRGWEAQVGTPFTLFVIVVSLQAVHSFVRFGSIAMTSIGMLSYFSALPAIVFAYQYAVRFDLKGITRWMWFYVFFASIALLGVYLEYIEVDWAALGEVGEGLIIYDVSMALKAYSGFFRSSEIAAWHTSTIACFVFLLLVGQRRSFARWALAAGLVLFLIGIGALTGRRKMLVQIAIFISMYFLLVAWFQRGATKIAGVIGFVGLASYIAIIGLVEPDPGDRTFRSHELSVAPDQLYQAYALRTRSVIEDIPDRISQLGFQPVTWVVEQQGWFGAGLGTGSQGAQHFGADEAIDRGAAEGGLGKLTMELGVPGLLIAIWFAYALGRYMWRVLGQLASTSQKHARVGYGMVAFMASNVAAFSVAAQAYGDIFILLCLGWALGFLLALPVLAQRAVQSAQRAPAPAPEFGTLRR